MRKVLIGTPSYSGEVGVYYLHAMIETVKLAIRQRVDLHAIFVSFDSLVQNARNDLVRYARAGNFQDLVFIDADNDWQPEWVMKLLSYPVDVVGGTYRKKTDEYEAYPVNGPSVMVPKDPATGLLMVDALGTGFLRISRRALDALWEDSEPYRVLGGPETRWVFDLRPDRGELVGEDVAACRKLKRLGFQVYLDPSMTCGHMGPKRWQGDFAAWLARRQAEARQQNPHPGRGPDIPASLPANGAHRRGEAA